MYSQSLLAFAATIVAANAASKGFNYGSSDTNGNPLSQSQFQALMNRANNLPGTSAFNSARLYTMIQGGTTNSPIQAIPAAVATKTELLLGMWCSAGQSVFSNELAALTSAISSYGSDFTSLVTGLSIGSEDLYRDSVTGITNNDGIGAGPDVLVSYIQQVRSALKGTALANVPIGHVDTWDAWVNGSNAAVIENVDWLGVDSYPYFETSVSNAIGAPAKKAFFDSYDATQGAAGGKPVWITETGWPVSGPVSGGAVASVQNAEEYWQTVGCEVLGNINTWWYTLQDAMPTTPSPSFGIIGSDLSSNPLYSLSCNASASSSQPSTSSTSQSDSTSSVTSASHKHTSAPGHSVSTTSSMPLSSSAASPTDAVNGGSSSTTAMPSVSAASSTPSPSSVPENSANQAGSAMGAAILAIFGLVAAL